MGIAFTQIRLPGGPRPYTKVGHIPVTRRVLMDVPYQSFTRSKFFEQLSSEGLLHQAPSSTQSLVECLGVPQHAGAVLLGHCPCHDSLPPRPRHVGAQLLYVSSSGLQHFLLRADVDHKMIDTEGIELLHVGVHLSSKAPQKALIVVFVKTNARAHLIASVVEVVDLTWQ